VLTICTVPTDLDAEFGKDVWAAAYSATTGFSNNLILEDPHCEMGTAYSYPWYIIVVDTNETFTGVSNDSDGYDEKQLHTQRHEVGHALGLHEAPDAL
jgi:hypothetical protein